MPKKLSELIPLAGERQSTESNSAVIACNDWLRLGPGRSLSFLAEKYTETHQKHPPTTSLNTLKQWSRRFEWTVRAAEFDANWEAIKTAERQAEFDFGLALDYERVRKLKRLADFLEAQLYEHGTKGEYHNVWLPDVKVVGHGEDAEAVDIERFNSALFTQYRETLSDLAAEVGGRIKRQEHAGPGGGAIQHEVKTTVDSSGFNDSISKLADALGAILSRQSATGNSPVGTPQ